MILESKGLRPLLLALALAGGLAASSASAQELPFDEPDPNYQGQIWAQNAESGKPFLPGATVAVGGQAFKPGQKVWFSRGIHPLTPEPLVADAEGRISAMLKIPENAPLGVHPIILSTENPYHAEILDLKISPELALSGAELFEVQTAKLAPGLYQSAYDAGRKALFVAAAAGWPPITQSEVLKVDPQTLEILARATPPEAPGGGLYAIYGIGVDEANGRVWVTNTRQDTVAVFAAEDLALIKQFEPGILAHPRDVAASAKTGKVYVSTVGAPGIAVFDAASLEPEASILILSRNSRQPFSPASLHLDEEGGKLFTTNLEKPEVAIVDLASGTLEKIIPVTGAVQAIGVSYDPQTKRLFVAAQGSDNLLILDSESGETLHDVAIGAGPLSVLFDPVSRLAYVSSRGANTITAVDAEGQVVANLDGGPQPNHLATDGAGALFAVNKGSEEDPAADALRLLRRAP